MKLFNIIFSLILLSASITSAQTIEGSESSNYISYEIRLFDWDTLTPVKDTEGDPATAEVSLWFWNQLCYDASLEPGTQWASFSDRSEMPIPFISGDPIVYRDSWYAIIVDVPGYLPSHGIVDFSDSTGSTVAHHIPMLSIEEAMNHGGWCYLDSGNIDKIITFENHQIRLEADSGTFENEWKFIVLESQNIPFHNGVGFMKLGHWGNWKKKAVFYWQMAIVDEDNNIIKNLNKTVTFSLKKDGSSKNQPPGSPGSSHSCPLYFAKPDISFYKSTLGDWFQVDATKAGDWPISFETNYMELDWAINVPENDGPWNVREEDDGEDGELVFAESVHGEDGEWYWIEVYRHETGEQKTLIGETPILEGVIIAGMTNNNSGNTSTEITNSETLNNTLNGSTGGEANFSFSAADIKGWFQGGFSNTRITVNGNKVIASNAYSNSMVINQGQCGNTNLNGVIKMYERFKHTWLRILVWKYVEDDEDELISEETTPKVKEVIGHSTEYISQ